MTPAVNMDEMGQKDRWAITRRQDRVEKLPIAQPSSSSAPDENAESASTTITGPKPTILVIDDEPPLQKFMRLTLTSQNFNVIEAMTGESGLRHAANDQPDLI